MTARELAEQCTSIIHGSPWREGVIDRIADALAQVRRETLASAEDVIAEFANSGELTFGKAAAITTRPKALATCAEPLRRDLGSAHEVLRDRFAMAALNALVGGWMASLDPSQKARLDAAVVSSEAYALADAMLKARQSKGGEG